MIEEGLQDSLLMKSLKHYKQMSRYKSNLSASVNTSVNARDSLFVTEATQCCVHGGLQEIKKSLAISEFFKTSVAICFVQQEF